VKHRCSLSVRSYELDVNNHVNHANYLNYLEHARLEFLKDGGFNFLDFLDRGYSIVVRKVTIQYHSPAFLDDTLIITTYPVARKVTSGTLKQEVVREEMLICSAEVNWVCLNDHGRPSKLPDKFNLSILSAP
jgi:YbgC/YbaW family acyl-CoA thioester hydrolase